MYCTMHEEPSEQSISQTVGRCLLTTKHLGSSDHDQVVKTVLSRSGRTSIRQGTIAQSGSCEQIMCITKAAATATSSPAACSSFRWCMGSSLRSVLPKRSHLGSESAHNIVDVDGNDKMQPSCPVHTVSDAPAPNVHARVPARRLLLACMDILGLARAAGMLRLLLLLLELLWQVKTAHQRSRASGLHHL